MPISSRQAAYDNKNQYEQVLAYLLPGEILQAVYDCKGTGTGFVGLTDQRLIFHDYGILIKKKTMVSIPYHRVIGIACVDDGLISRSTEIAVLTTAGNFTFEFREASRAEWVYHYVMSQILTEVDV